jgi:hypothetical protein
VTRGQIALTPCQAPDCVSLRQVPDLCQDVLDVPCQLGLTEQAPLLYGRRAAAIGPGAQHHPDAATRVPQAGYRYDIYLVSPSTLQRLYAFFANTPPS